MNNSELIPVSIVREGDAQISITWSDGAVSNWTAGQLRKICPCATCREKKRGESEASEPLGKLPMLPVLSTAEARPIEIQSMQPVGNYAYSIVFSDNHSSGVFTFDLLRGDTPVG